MEFELGGQQPPVLSSGTPSEVLREVRQGQRELGREKNKLEAGSRAGPRALFPGEERAVENPNRVVTSSSRAGLSTRPEY